MPLPQGAVENGEVRQPEVVGEALRELWRRGGFKDKQVVMGVGNQRVVVREVALPWLPEKELRESLAFQVQEFIPMSVDEAVLDFDALGRVRAGRPADAADAPRGGAEGPWSTPWSRPPTRAKLEPVGLDLMPFALVRAVGTPEGGHGARDAGRRGRDRRRRGRHEHLRARRADHPVRPHPALRGARRDARDRAGPRASRTRSPRR